MLHEVVDISRWKSVFALDRLRSELQGLHPNMQLGGMRINSPFHIAVVEQLREESLTGKYLANRISVDIFVWNVGEPSRREITKIGGLPYRSSSQKWLYSESGQPLTFIGQVCFVDSKELINSLPGDILLIFAETKVYGVEWDDNKNLGFVFEWVSIGDFPLIEKSNIPQTKWNPLPLYGSIFRTYDYPDSADFFKQHNDYGLLSILEATKINGAPFWIQQNSELGGRFLCSIASVEPAISGKHAGIKTKSYPYIN